MGILANLRTYVRRRFPGLKEPKESNEIKHKPRIASLSTQRHSRSKKRHNHDKERPTPALERGRKRERDPDPEPEPEISAYHWRTRKNAPLPQLPRRHFQTSNMSGSSSTSNLLPHPRPGVLLNQDTSASTARSSSSFATTANGPFNSGIGSIYPFPYGEFHTARSISLTRLTISRPAHTLISVSAPSKTAVAEAKAQIKADKHARRKQNYLQVSAAVTERLASGVPLMDSRIVNAALLQANRRRRRADVERKERSWVRWGGLAALALESGDRGGTWALMEEMEVVGLERLKQWRRDFGLTEEEGIAGVAAAGLEQVGGVDRNESEVAGAASVTIDDAAKKEGEMLTAEVEAGPKLLKKVRKKLRKRSMPQFDMVVRPGERISMRQ